MVEQTITRDPSPHASECATYLEKVHSLHQFSVAASTLTARVYRSRGLGGPDEATDDVVLVLVPFAEVHEFKLVQQQR
eukprot:3642147-Amphidinium_carterae.1